MVLSKDFFHLAIQAAIEAGKAILEVYNSADFQVETKNDNSPLTMADKRAHDIIMLLLEQTGIPILSEEGKSIPYETRRQWKQFWLVDPLDGTKEFIKRNGEFTVNIALIEDSHPVFGVIYVPVTDVLYVGEAGNEAVIMDNAMKQLAQNQFILCKTQKLPYKKHTSFGIVASRSHLNEETTAFINQMKQQYENVHIISKGSSLKICMVAEGEADVYPRFGLTSEWDTAAGHAIALASGATVTIANTNEPLTYNKENILNPWFIVKRSKDQ
jgi:3'(2'), 5'-bisphosphate nucleotidase